MRWTATTRSGWSSARNRLTPLPMSPPAAPNRSYPSAVISSRPEARRRRRRPAADRPSTRTPACPGRRRRTRPRGPSRVGEQRDHLAVPPERVGPAVRQDERQSARGGRAGVHDVDPTVAQRDVEPGMPGQRRLLRGPVEPVGPVGDELPQVVEVGAQRPAGVLGRLRPARRPQPRPQVLDGLGRGRRAERLGHAAHPRGGLSQLRPGARAVEPRTTSSGANSCSTRDGFSPRISARSASTAARQTASTGWRTVVSGGSANATSRESSYPSTDTSCGTRSPFERAARMAPRAMRSEPQTIAVCPESSRSVAAACPPSAV